MSEASVFSGAIFRPLLANQRFARHRLLLILSSRILMSSAAHTSASSAKLMTLVPAGRSMRRKSSYIVMGHRCQNIENIDVLLSIIDFFNIDIALSMSMCKYRYKVSMSIFFRCFYGTFYTFCLLASCRTWLVNSIRDIDFSSETVGKNQSSSAARQ